MKEILACGAAIGLFVMAAGCDGLGSLFSPTTIAVEFVNDGTFPVEAHLFYGSDQNALESVLREFGEETQLTISAGGTQTISRSCDDVQAMVLDAELSIIGEVGPQADSEVLRDGENFNCGDVVTFRFSHSVLVVDFRVTSSIR